MKNYYNNIFNIVKKSFYLLLLMLLFPVTTSAQNCSAELSVHKNRPFKSLNVSRNQNTVYKLKLVNTSNTQQTYSISTTQPDINCSNNTLRKRIREENSELLVSLSQKTKTVTLKPGQEFEFLVTVAATKNSKTQRWGCVEVLVKTDNCSKIASKILSTYITRGEND